MGEARKSRKGKGDWEGNQATEAPREQGRNQSVFTFCKLALLTYTAMHCEWESHGSLLVRNTFSWLGIGPKSEMA